MLFGNDSAGSFVTITKAKIQSKEKAILLTF